MLGSIKRQSQQVQQPRTSKSQPRIQTASAQTVAIRLLTASDSRDLPTLQALIAPSAVLHGSGRNPMTGDRQGLSFIPSFFAQVDVIEVLARNVTRWPSVR
ncbi:hypothetical protein HNQ08_001956 [Deinococcus humi]|uniref:Uncharacterized protein n=1 Tax=Deinococcus humi TaxID=662880 RepID=A0A7W8JU58_9DEIO|nr:hypothetical protein [Deinococcus humi]GGO25943.1 hypothetical protein GCM10008949_16220 [Deinococcus humi]